MQRMHDIGFAYSCLHRASEKCSEEFEWQLDKSTQTKFLENAPSARIRAWSRTLTFRRCPDCGWRIDFTKDQIEWVENKTARKARTDFLKSRPPNALEQVEVTALSISIRVTAR
jgi:hypothetical protein